MRGLTTRWVGWLATAVVVAVALCLAGELAQQWCLPAAATRLALRQLSSDEAPAPLLRLLIASRNGLALTSTLIGAAVAIVAAGCVGLHLRRRAQAQRLEDNHPSGD